MNPTVETGGFSLSVSAKLLPFRRQPRAASCSLIALLLFLSNLSLGRSEAEEKCPYEMGWPGGNTTIGEDVCKTWLSVKYDESNEMDILDQAIATCNDLPNGRVLEPSTEDLGQQGNETNRVEGSAIYPWRLLDFDEHGENVTVTGFELTSGELRTGDLAKTKSFMSTTDRKNLPNCKFEGDSSREAIISSCSSHDGALRVLCGSSKLKHCTPDGRTCQCDPGWEGRFCAKEQNKCKTDSCMNGGICITTGGQASCICLPGSSGALCEVDGEDDCEKVSCSHHGKCEHKLRDFECKCDVGYTGNFCEMAILSSATMVSISRALPLLVLVPQAIASWHPALLASY